jgi:SAM-dependent methyltransferase
MDKTFYPNHQQSWDDSLLRERISARLARDSVVLDLGAGAGIINCMDFRAFGARICGIDLDSKVLKNPYLHEARIADVGSIPYPNFCFDVVFCNNVLEHLADPEAVFAEVARVLKPGGAFLFKTPNKWPYVPLVAQATPHFFHVYFKRMLGRPDEDTFPTLYRANSRQAIRQFAAGAGFDVEALELIEGRPEYLRLHPMTYAVGLGYERLVNSYQFLAGLRVIIIRDAQEGAMTGPALQPIPLTQIEAVYLRCLRRQGIGCVPSRTWALM